MIKVHKEKMNYGSESLYSINKKDAIKLETIIEQYNIIVLLKIFKTSAGKLLLYKFELDYIEKQWKLARKQERQTK